MRKVIFPTLMAALLMSGCSKGDRTADEAAQALQVERGEALFQQHCDSCHPRQGRGDYLKRIPATLLVRRSEAELAAWIEGSDEHREMPNFTNLDKTEKQDLASYLLDQITTR